MSVGVKTGCWSSQSQEVGCVHFHGFYPQVLKRRDSVTIIKYVQVILHNGDLLFIGKVFIRDLFHLEEICLSHSVPLWLSYVTKQRTNSYKMLWWSQPMDRVHWDFIEDWVMLLLSETLLSHYWVLVQKRILDGRSETCHLFLRVLSDDHGPQGRFVVFIAIARLKSHFKDLCTWVLMSLSLILHG